MFAPVAVEVMMPERFAVPNCAPPTALSMPAMVEDDVTESAEVVAAVAEIVVAVSPPLKAMEVVVALLIKG